MFMITSIKLLVLYEVMLCLFLNCILLRKGKIWGVCKLSKVLVKLMIDFRFHIVELLVTLLTLRLSFSNFVAVVMVYCEGSRDNALVFECSFPFLYRI